MQRRKRAVDGFRPSLPVQRAPLTATLRTRTIILMLHLLKIIKIHMLLTLPQIQMAAHGMPQPPPQHHQPINNDQIKNQDQIKIDQINKIDWMNMENMTPTQHMMTHTITIMVLTILTITENKRQLLRNNNYATNYYVKHRFWIFLIKNVQK